jgi:hypothetical protein
MLRVVVISALVAAAIAAPTWTSQLAQATEEKAELSSLATSYGFECKHNERPYSILMDSTVPEDTYHNLTTEGLNYTNFGTTSSRACQNHCLHNSLCKAYWWQQQSGSDPQSYDYLHRQTGECYTTDNFTAPYEHNATSYARHQWTSDGAGEGLSEWCYVEEHEWDGATTHSTTEFDGIYQENCHCTACHFEYKDSGHLKMNDITSCAQECSETEDCQTVLHDHHKRKCFFYKMVNNSHNTPVPDLAKSSTYNEHETVRNEFSCWYKCPKSGCPEGTVTVAPTTPTPSAEPTLAPAVVVTEAPEQTTNLDKWDSSTKGSTISLSNGDRTMTTTTSNAHTWNSVYGTFEVSGSGKHTWTVNITRLDNGTPNYWELGIGVANTTTSGNSVFFAPFTSGVAYIQETGGVTSVNSVSDGSISYGAAYYLGDLISIEIDFDSNPKTITAYKNGISQGVMSNDVEGTYRLACMAGDELDSVEIVGYTSS